LSHVYHTPDARRLPSMVTICERELRDIILTQAYLRSGAIRPTIGFMTTDSRLPVPILQWRTQAGQPASRPICTRHGEKQIITIPPLLRSSLLVRSNTCFRKCFVSVLLKHVSKTLVKCFFAQNVSENVVKHFPGSRTVEIKQGCYMYHRT